MIHKTLGEMTDAEIGAIVRAYKSGKNIEHINGDFGWRPCRFTPLWDLEVAYRIAPEPIRQAVIPWEIFTNDVIAVAMDENGDWYAYNYLPRLGNEYWTSADDCFSIKHLKFDRGNEPDWNNTLQMRPGYEEGK
jgi:hypothetical protein